MRIPLLLLFFFFCYFHNEMRGIFSHFITDAGEFRVSNKSTDNTRETRCAGVRGG